MKHATKEQKKSCQTSQKINSNRTNANPEEFRAQQRKQHGCLSRRHTQPTVVCGVGFWQDVAQPQTVGEFEFGSQPEEHVWIRAMEGTELQAEVQGIRNGGLVERRGERMEAGMARMSRTMRIVTIQEIMMLIR